MRVLVLSTLILATAAAGCIGVDQSANETGGSQETSGDAGPGCTGRYYTYQAGSSTPADVDETFQVNAPCAVQFTLQAGGWGGAEVRVTDGAGEEVLVHDIGDGGSQRTGRLDGAPGTWRLTVDFDGYQGGFQLTLSSTA